MTGIRSRKSFDALWSVRRTDDSSLDTNRPFKKQSRRQGRRLVVLFRVLGECQPT